MACWLLEGFVEYYALSFAAQNGWIDLNENMIRAIARQAEAERDRRAKVINAEGEFQAAQKLLEAERVK